MSKIYVELTPKMIETYKYMALIFNKDTSYYINKHIEKYGKPIYKSYKSGSVFDPSYGGMSGVKISYSDIASVPTVFCGSHPGIIGVNIPF
jgi:hypothetical protein